MASLADDRLARWLGHDEGGRRRQCLRVVDSLLESLNVRRDEIGGALALEDHPGVRDQQVFGCGRQRPILFVLALVGPIDTVAVELACGIAQDCLVGGRIERREGFVGRIQLGKGALFHIRCLRDLERREGIHVYDR